MCGGGEGGGGGELDGGLQEMGESLQLGDDFEMGACGVVIPLYGLCNLNPRAALYEVNSPGIEVGLQLYY